MQAGWSPDGKYISYVSDKDGEFNIYLRDAVTGKERKLIKGLKSYIFNYKWSPDSKKIMWSEKGNTLNISDVESGKREIVEQSGIRSMTSYNWSPDSKYITYVRPEAAMDNIIVYNVKSRTAGSVQVHPTSVTTANTSCSCRHVPFRPRTAVRNGITCTTT